LNYGSWNLLRFRADATGSLPKNKKLLYRFIAGGSKSESFRDFQKTNDLFLAPSLSYLFSNKTKLTLEYNFINEGYTYPFDYGTYAGVNADGTPNFGIAPLSFSGSNPNDKGRATSNMVYLNFEHKFTNSIKFNILANYNNRNTVAAQHLSGFGFFNATNDTILGRAYIDFNNKSFNYNINSYATFNFSTGKSVKHTLIAGIDYGKYGISDNTFSFNYGNVLPLPINNPNYSLDNPSSYVYDDPTFGIKETDTEDKRIIGGYIQNYTDFGKVKLLLGLRYDNFKALNTFFPNYQTEATRDTSDADALLPRIGLVYQPVNNLSFYASYSTSFRPQTSNNSLSGGPFEPEKGVQYEVGIKSELIKNKVLATLSLYSIDKNNLLIRDVTDPTGQRRIAVDAVNSKGVELTLQGNISKVLNLILNYAYNDAQFTSDTKDNKKGDRLINAPRHIVSSWATYNIGLNENSRIKIGAGIRYNSDAVSAFSANPQTFLMPSYTVADASIGYNYKNIGLQFNLNNIADTRYFTGAYGFVSVFPGSPRNFRMALTYQF
jgi:iron complex outermembrane receptor protein